MARDIGSSEYFEVASAPVTAVPFTVCGWGKVADVTNFFIPLISIADSGAADQLLFRLDFRGDQADDKVKLFVWDGTNTVELGSTTAYSANTWHHVCGVGAASNDWRIYLDGGSKNTSSTTVTPTGQNVCSVGRTGDSTPTNAYVGHAAELAIWNVALTDDEILSLAKGLSPSRVRPLSLKGHWRGVEKSGSLIDYSKFGNDMAETGTISSVDHPPIFPGFGNDDDLIVVPADVTVSPGLATLTITAFAPTVAVTDHQTVAPGVSTLTITAFAPTVTQAVNVNPGVATLTLTAFAPTVAVSDHQTVAPGVAALTLTAFAPTIGVTAHVTVAPGLATLSITAFAPTIAVTADVPVTPGVAALTLTAFAPTIGVTDLITVAPGLASLTITAFAPVVQVTGDIVVAPGVASLSITAFAPTITQITTVAPGLATLSLTAFAPTVAVTDHVTVTPGAAALILSAFAPTVQLTGHILVSPGVATLTIIGFEPTVTAAEPVIPTAGFLSRPFFG